MQHLPSWDPNNMYLGICLLRLHPLPRSVGIQRVEWAARIRQICGASAQTFRSPRQSPVPCLICCCLCSCTFCERLVVDTLP